MKPKKILFVSKDPGGVNSIIPLIKECLIHLEKFECVVIAHKLTEHIYIKEKIPFFTLDNFDYCSDHKVAVLNILKTFKPNLIVTGSSRPYEHEPKTPEQFFTEISKKENIYSINVLDYWGEYLERFSIFNGEFDPMFIADKICALDFVSKKSLLKIGVKEENIEITHSPYFDKVVKNSINFKIKEKSSGSNLNVLFVSQPLVEYKNKYYQGYTQIDMFKNLLFFLTSYKYDITKNIKVWLHPKEKKEIWDEIVDRNRTEFITIEVNNNRDAKIFEWADLVVSGFSTIIYEALYYSIPVISMQVGLNKKDQLITNELSLSTPIYSKSELISFSENFDINFNRKMLKKQKNKLTEKQVFFSDGFATKRIINLIKELNININEPVT